MALELRFYVLNLNEAVAEAGYTVIDSTRNEIENGTTSIAEDGLAIIPITSKWVSEGESLRVTIDNYGGGVGFSQAGAAIDTVKATTVYVDFSVNVRDNYFVDCKIQTGETTPWDMGDGTTLYEENPTHLYLKNGTYTITNGDFSTEVVITGVEEFSVALEGNIITCIPQSGTTGNWDFGDGESEENIATTHEFYENGAYLVTNSGFEQEIVVDYFSESIVNFINGNSVTFTEPERYTSALFEYGDGTFGEELTHDYATHGKYLVVNGDRINYVNIEGSVMPTAGFSAIPSEADSSIVTFTGKGGDTYETLIEGQEYDTLQVKHDFANSGIYPITVRAINVNGNADKITKNVTVLVNNTAPVGNITYSSDALEVTFNANVVDEDFQASHTYLWTFNAGEEYEDTSRDANPVHTYFPPETANDPNGQTFTVTCLVTDDRGDSVLLSTDLTVYDYKTFGNNLIVNGDFDDLGNNLWSSNNDSQVSYDIIEYEGRNVLHVAASGGSQGRATYELTGLEVGKMYDLTYTMKANAVIVYENTDNAGVTLSHGGALTPSTRIENGGFVEVTEEFEALADTLQVRVYVRRGGGELWLDSINISEAQ